MVGSVAVAITSKRRLEVAKLIAAMTSVGVAAMSVWLLSTFEMGEAGFQFTSQHTWIEQWGISYHVGVDGISLFLVVLTGFLLPVILLACWTDIVKRSKEFIFFMMALQTGMLGAFLSLSAASVSPRVVRRHRKAAGPLLE